MTTFTTGMSGPAAVAALNALDVAAGAYVYAVRFDSSQGLTVTQQAQARVNINVDGVSVFDYLTPTQAADVIAGTASVDTAPAFVSAIATGKPVHVPAGPGWIYLLGSQTAVPSNTTIYSDRAKLKVANGVNAHAFLIANGADNVEIRGLEIDGNRANNTGGTGIGMRQAGGTRIRIRNNYIHDCSSHGIYIYGDSAFGANLCYGIDVDGNYCYNNHDGGITIAADAVQKYTIQRNFCWNNGTHGAGILGSASHGSIVNNVGWDNGQGTPNADNFTGYSHLIVDLVVAGNISYGGLNNGIHFGGSNVTYTGNVANGATFYGIAHNSETGERATNVTMVGNQTYNNGYDGIRIYHVDTGSVTGNIANVNRRGITTDTCTGIKIIGNDANSNTYQGIYNYDASSDLTYIGNTLQSNGTDGIGLAYVTYSQVSGNTVKSNGGWGINSGTSESHNVIGPNIVRSNTSGQVNTMDSTTSVYGNYDGTNKIITGTGKIVLDTSPTITTPAITGGAINDSVIGGSTAAAITGTTITANTGFVGPLTGNVTGNVSGTAPAGSLTGTTLNSTVVTSSLTSVGTLVSLTVSGAVNKVTITAPATGSTLTIADGKTLTVSKTITLTGTDGTTMTFPAASSTLARTTGTNTFTGQQTFGTIVSSGASGADALQILNSSVTGTKGWDFYPVTNGTDSDMRLYEFATSGSGDRFIFKAGGALLAANSITCRNATATPAGGTAGAGFMFSSTANFGIFFGSGAPTLSAAQGSMYLRSDGSSILTRAYINTDGSTTWTAITTAA